MTPEGGAVVLRTPHHVLLSPTDVPDHDASLSSETLGVLLDAAWRKDEAMVSSYDVQTTRAGAVIGGSVAVTALFGSLLVIDTWLRFAFLVPLAAQALACIYGVKAWRVRTLNRAPEREALRDYRGWEVTDAQDQLIPPEPPPPPPPGNPEWEERGADDDYDTKNGLLKRSDSD